MSGRWKSTSMLSARSAVHCRSGAFASSGVAKTNSRKSLRLRSRIVGDTSMPVYATYGECLGPTFSSSSTWPSPHPQSMTLVTAFSWMKSFTYSAL